VNEPGERPQYPIESVDNALRLLLLFEQQREVRLAEASAHLGVASSTAHRLLAMLQYRGFARQNPSTRAYEPGPALGTISAAVLRHLDVRALARPALDGLNRLFGETVHLGRLDGVIVTFVDSVESPRAVRVASRAGRSLPAHATATGKAALSLLTPDEFAMLYPREQLVRITPHTIGTRTLLLEALEVVRRRGHATTNGESEEGVESMSVPFALPSGGCYAVTVSVPTNRMDDELATRIVPALHKTVTGLRDRLF
jgi:IclR family acetate operon transcriptional repressor